MSTPAPNLSLWIRFSRKFTNPLDWNSLDRSLLLVGIYLYVLIVYGITLELYKRMEFSAYFNRQVLDWVATLCWAGATFYAGLLLAGLYGRRRRERWPAFSHLLAQGFVIGAVWTAYFPGMFSTNSALTLVTGIAVGVPLLDKRPVFWAFVSGMANLLFLIIAQDAGWLPYAPLFKTPPLLEGGRPHEVWATGQAILLVGANCVTWLVMTVLIDRWREREALLEQLSTTDALTTLSNRRHFLKVLDAECVRARRTGSPMSLLMIDVDHFKRVNDTYGHKVGDRVLAAVGRCLGEQMRSGIDLAGRLGGEEFAVLLLETPLEGGCAVAGRIREALGAVFFGHEGATFRVTVSVGASSMVGQGVDPDALLEAADALLYRAKREGRDRIVAATVEQLRHTLAVSPRG